MFRNGERGADCATAEAAFEVVTMRTSIEIRSDNEVLIHVKPAPER